MGRKKPRQRSMFVPPSATRAPSHRFYEKLDELLNEAGFDDLVEQQCEPFFEPDRSKGRHSIPPGVYFRMLMIGYFEGIESERGICWRCEDSLSLRAFPRPRHRGSRARSLDAVSDTDSVRRRGLPRSLQVRTADG